MRKITKEILDKMINDYHSGTSLIELSGHSGDGMPFRIIGMLNIRKSLQSGFFLMFSSTSKVLKKLKKITQICLTYLTSLCYSKKCAIVDSYAMTAYEKQQKIRCF